jgi:hypothetical protein
MEQYKYENPRQPQDGVYGGKGGKNFADFRMPHAHRTPYARTPLSF